MMACNLCGLYFRMCLAAQSVPRPPLLSLQKSLPMADRQKLNSTGVTRVYYTSTGERKVCGGPRLKSTQTYTPQFGRFVAFLRKRYVLKMHVKNRMRWFGRRGVQGLAATKYE